MALQQITENDFESIISSSSLPVALYIYSPTCHTCQDTTPFMEELSDELGSRCTFLKVDVNSDVEVARRYGVTGTPTILLFANGSEKDRIVGRTDKATVSERIEALG